MSFLLPRTPLERIASFEGDVLLPLKRLREKYISEGNPRGAAE